MLHMNMIATSGCILEPKYSSAIDTGVLPRLYVAPEAAEMVIRTCSLTLNGQGFSENDHLVNGKRTFQAGSTLESHCPT